ncbi:hypothetical protein EVG20_g10078, partial [Dentipellis fragilis]
MTPTRYPGQSTDRTTRYLSSSGPNPDSKQPGTVPVADKARHIRTMSTALYLDLPTLYWLFAVLCLGVLWPSSGHSMAVSAPHYMWTMRARRLGGIVRSSLGPCRFDKRDELHESTMKVITISVPHFALIPHIPVLKLTANHAAITQETGDAFRNILKQVDRVGLFTLNYHELSPADAGINHLRRNVPQRMKYAESIILEVQSRDGLQGLLNRSTGPAPKLEHLSLEYGKSDAVVCAPKDFLADSAPRLEQLELENCSILWTSSLFKNLSILEVTFPLIDGPHPLPMLFDLFNALHQHESLEHLLLSGALPVFKEADHKW